MRAVEADQVSRADAAIEVEQVGAAAQQHVLAVVQFFAGLRVFERPRPAAERPAGFEQRDGAPADSSATAAAMPASPPPTTTTRSGAAHFPSPLYSGEGSG